LSTAGLIEKATEAAGKSVPGSGGAGLKHPYSGFASQAGIGGPFGIAMLAACVAFIANPAKHVTKAACAAMILSFGSVISSPPLF